MTRDDPRRVGDEDYKAFDYPDYDEDYCEAAKAAQERTDASDIHTCSYHCHRPQCIQQQRDQMREYIYNVLGAEKFREMMVYKVEVKK